MYTDVSYRCSLIVLLMYIAVYPIALSIRASNVYEERSMGVFEDSDDEDSDEEEARLERKSLPTYIAHHGRKLLSFDLWWIVFAIWLICIIEVSPSVVLLESVAHFAIQTAKLDHRPRATLHLHLLGHVRGGQWLRYRWAQSRNHHR